MEKPFNTHTVKRHTAFSLAALSFLSIYTFGIEITSLDNFGMQVRLPAAFARTVLFWVTVFLFLRYALDVMSEAVFFTWHKNWRSEAGKWMGIWSKNKNAIVLLSVPASKASVMQLIGGDAGKIQAYAPELGALASRLEHLYHNKARSASDDDPLPEMIEILEDARPLMLRNAIRMRRAALWRMFRTGVGLIPFVVYVIFDIAVPVLLILLVFSVAYGDPTWMKYENVPWLWISDPTTVIGS